MRQVIFQGSIVGRDQLTNLEFNPTFFFSGCLICGEVYQTDEDRNPPTVDDPEYGPFLINQKERHMAWRNKENNRHPERVHRQLAISGQFCTPEAAMKLAPLGLFSLTDIVMSDEIQAALKEAPRAPSTDAQHDINPKGLVVRSE